MKTTLIAQLSDPHIREPGRLAYGRINTAPYLVAAVQTLLRLPQQPDAVVITGDLCDFGRPAEYEHLQALLAPLPMPVYLLPGNHDDRDQLRKSFSQHHYLGTTGYVQYSLPVGEVQLIALDTVVPQSSEGSLCEQRLAWLEDQLQTHSHRPVIIAMHHPPFQTLIGHMDKIGLLRGAGALEALLAQHANVERVICGHLHRPIQVRFGGSLAMTAPSTAHQVCLDLSDTAASTWTLEPPGFGLHAWRAGMGLISHTVASGHYEGPFPFHDDSGLID
jgi:3',5'-cyclic AMP phosphodiesterase CpdA